MNAWLDQHRMLVFSTIGLLLAAAIGSVALRLQAPTPMVINPPPPTATSSPIQVYVSGAVSKPDVYSLPPDAIVRDVLNAAGGATADADMSSINLAEALHDGDQIHVPRIGEQPTAPPVVVNNSDVVLEITGLININTATAAQLETLPEIGPAIAQRIIDYRETHGPFATIEDIQNVKGIGPATFDAIKDLITVD